MDESKQVRSIDISVAVSAVRWGVEQFLLWWVTELKSLVPLRFRRLFDGNPLVVAVDGDRVSVTCRGTKNGPSRFEGSLSDIALLADGLRTVSGRGKSQRSAVMLVPASIYLRRTMHLPLAVRAHLDQAVRYQLGRISPFRDGDIYHLTRVASLDLQSKVLVAEVVIVAKREIDRLDAIVRALGLSPVKYVFADLTRDTEAQAMALATPQQIAHKRLSHIDYGLAALVAILALGVVWSFHARRVAINERLAAQIDTLRPDAARVSDLKAELDRQTVIAAGIVAAKSTAVQQLMVLDRLAAHLPDDVRLIDYRSNDDGIHISGYASDASRLLATIDQIDGFKAAKFSSPVSRDAQSGLDRFSLLFKVKDGP